MEQALVSQHDALHSSVAPAASPGSVLPGSSQPLSQAPLFQPFQAPLWPLVEIP